MTKCKGFTYCLAAIASILKKYNRISDLAGPFRNNVLNCNSFPFVLATITLSSLDYIDSHPCHLISRCKKFQVPSIGEGSGPAFSKFITTPLCTFCTNDSRHWFSILGEHTQYDRPRTKQSRLRFFSVSALILTCIIQNCSPATHIDLCMDHWLEASPEHSFFV